MSGRADGDTGDGAAFRVVRDGSALARCSEAAGLAADPSAVVAAARTLEVRPGHIPTVGTTPARERPFRITIGLPLCLFEIDLSMGRVLTRRVRLLPAFEGWSRPGGVSGPRPPKSPEPPRDPRG